MDAGIADSGRIDERREFLHCPRKVSHKISYFKHKANPHTLPHAPCLVTLEHSADGKARESSTDTHRHVRQAKAVEHAMVRILELREVNVLLEGLVLRAELGEAARSVHGIVEGRRRQARCELFGR